jgi:cyclic-di-GMP-binding protein
MASFDIVSRVDMQEVDNAVNQVRREIQTRYDFRSGKSTIEFDKNSIILLGEDSMKLKALREMLNEKIAKRGVGVRVLDYAEPESAAGGTFRQVVTIKQGISTDDARAMVKIVKELNMKKVQAQIQQDQVRVIGSKKDDLQAAIKTLRERTNLELQFVNFKD